MIVAALAARGLNYSIVAERRLETYAEVALVPPACETSDRVGACTTTPRFEDYVFVNNESTRLVLTNVETPNFVNYWQLPVKVPLMSQHLYRGWTTVYGMIGERAFRLVDVYFSRATRGDLQVLQTQEIIADPMFLASGLTDTWQNPSDPG